MPSWIFEILNASMLQIGNSSHHAKLHDNRSNVAEIRRLSDFLKMANVHHLGFFVCLHHREEHLMVFVIVQNLVGIDEVVSII